MHGSRGLAGMSSGSTANVTMLDLRAGVQKANWNWAFPAAAGGPQRRPEDFMRADIVILWGPPIRRQIAIQHLG